MTLWFIATDIVPVFIVAMLDHKGWSIFFISGNVGFCGHFKYIGFIPCSRLKLK